MALSCERFSWFETLNETGFGYTNISMNLLKKLEKRPFHRVCMLVNIYMAAGMTGIEDCYVIHVLVVLDEE